MTSDQFDAFVLEHSIKRVTYRNLKEPLPAGSQMVDSIELDNGVVLMFSSEVPTAGKDRDGAVMTLAVEH